MAEYNGVLSICMRKPTRIQDMKNVEFCISVTSNNMYVGYIGLPVGL